MSRQQFRTGVTWPDGTNQDSAPFGAGLKYLYNTSTANTDPGSGNIKFDNTTLSSITVLRISETDALGAGLASLIQSLDDNGTTIRATVFMAKDTDPSTFLIFNIAGAFTDNGTWDNCTITYVASAGTFTNGDAVRLTFSRTGATGSTGANGSIDWQWSFLAGTSPPSFGGDWSCNNASLLLATEIYLAHGTSAQGDPSTLFIGWETDLRKGWIKATNSTNPTNWFYWKFTAVDDISPYTKFVITIQDHQGSNPVAGVNWIFQISPWPLLSELGTAGDASTNTATSVDSEVALFSSTTGKILKRATGSGVPLLTSGVLSISNVDNTSNATERAATATLTNKRVTKRVGTTTSSATPTINTDNVDLYTITALAANITSMTTNLSGTPTDGQTLWIAITGTATRTIAWGTSFEASTVALPVTTSGTNRLDIGFVWNAATSKWRCIAAA